MSKLIGIVFAVLVLLILVGKCAAPDDVYDPEVENAKMRAEWNTPSLPPTDEGFVVPGTIEPNVEYRILSISRLASGNLEILSRRDGTAGTSFARREYDCDQKTFRYLGEGDTAEQAKRDSPNIGEMSDLVEGSSASSVGTAACARGPM